MTDKQLNAASKKYATLMGKSPKYSAFADQPKSVQYGMIFGQKFKANDGQTLQEIHPDDFLHIAGKIRYILMEATDEGL